MFYYQTRSLYHLFLLFSLSTVLFTLTLSLAFSLSLSLSRSIVRPSLPLLCAEPLWLCGGGQCAVWGCDHQRLKLFDPIILRLISFVPLLYTAALICSVCCRQEPRAHLVHLIPPLPESLEPSAGQTNKHTHSFYLTLYLAGHHNTSHTPLLPIGQLWSALFFCMCVGGGGVVCVCDNKWHSSSWGDAPAMCIDPCWESIHAAAVGSPYMRSQDGVFCQGCWDSLHSTGCGSPGERGPTGDPDSTGSPSPICGA